MTLSGHQRLGSSFPEEILWAAYQSLEHVLEKSPNYYTRYC